MSGRIKTGLIVVVFLVVDFVTKRYVLANEDTFRQGIPVIDGLLQFTYVRNGGAAFGMFQGGRWPFVIVSAVTVVALSWVLFRSKSVGLRAYAYAMILAGAAGNLIDRLFYDGLVVDFILMYFKDSKFPVYNVADIGVSVGAVLLVLAMMRGEESEDAAATESEGTTVSSLGDSSPPPAAPHADAPLDS